MKQALLIFAKNLIHGRVKTRLAATLGHHTAYAVYKQLLVHTAETAAPVDADKIVFYSHYIEEHDLWNEKQFAKQIQEGKNLGERMSNAFARAFNQGYQQVSLIGTDCYEITTAILQESFIRLQENDIVSGPARDGGYYLIAMNTLHPELFINIPWSTATVFSETLRRIDHKNLSCYLLPELSDVDTEHDLKLLKDFPYDQHYHSNI